MKPFFVRRSSWFGKWMIAAVSLVGLTGIAQAVDDAQPQAALTTVSSLAPNFRPQNVPLDYVITPNGYFAASCVHAVANGEKVHADGSIEALDGSIRKPAACTLPHYTQSGVRIEANGAFGIVPQSKKPASSYSGWLLTADYVSSSDVGSISATWTVPSNPSKTTDQVDYFFPGLEQNDSNPDSILQPVLGYNAFSGSGVSEWTLSSWNCCYAGSTYYSGPINTAAGHEIYGIVTATCTSTSTSSTCAKITSTDETSKTSTTFTTSPYGALTWVFGGTLEAYNISNCDLLPASGSVAFTSIVVKNMSGTTLSNPWSPDNIIGSSGPNCNYGISTSNGSVTLKY
ncbi:hypothetical protein [Dyella caseinilytica]|uniref:Secreted protein n=1 Tax=Dyella caseinilytica TaxID=1849581 RepID=A0ABX7GXJ3_9GAMM|nr:hypothetical protein [Dyella caseinilytica]QRN55196.1 hypothetical protein ISN74_07660 [Dyella caseinilytica]GGA00047.1 hypothetical protein GCM10011408_21060 [Dyella caseinilytica]